MNTCNTCRCNKICNHDLYGFENCNNYIPTENFIPKTHFDRIKAMSVEELAKFLVNLKVNGHYHCNYNRCVKHSDNCENCIKAYLEKRGVGR